MSFKSLEYFLKTEFQKILTQGLFRISTTQVPERSFLTRGISLSTADSILFGEIG